MTSFRDSSLCIFEDITFNCDIIRICWVIYLERKTRGPGGSQFILTLICIWMETCFSSVNHKGIILLRLSSLQNLFSRTKIRRSLQCRIPTQWGSIRDQLMSLFEELWRVQISFKHIPFHFYYNIHFLCSIHIYLPPEKA